MSSSVTLQSLQDQYLQKDLEIGKLKRAAAKREASRVTVIQDFQKELELSKSQSAQKQMEIEELKSKLRLFEEELNEMRVRNDKNERKIGQLVMQNDELEEIIKELEGAEPTIRAEQLAIVAEVKTEQPETTSQESVKTELLEAEQPACPETEQRDLMEAEQPSYPELEQPEQTTANALKRAAAPDVTQPAKKAKIGLAKERRIALAAKKLEMNVGKPSEPLPARRVRGARKIFDL